MDTQTIRIRLKAFDHRTLDQSVSEIVIGNIQGRALEGPESAERWCQSADAQESEDCPALRIRYNSS